MTNTCSLSLPCTRGQSAAPGGELSMTEYGQQLLSIAEEKK